MVVARRAGAAPAGERHLGALHGLVTVQRRLSALVGARGAEPRSVTALLAAELGLPAAVVGRDLTVLAASAPGVSDAEAADNVAARATPTAAAPDPWTRVLGAAAATGRALRVPGPGMRSHVVVGVLVADAVTSFLVVEEDRSARVRAADLDGDDLALLVAEQAATVLAVLASRQQVLATAAGHVRGDLLSGLLLDRARHPGEAAQWAEHVGYDADVAHRVLLVVPRDDLGPLAGLLTEADDYLTTAVPGVLSVVRDTEVAALVPDDADPVTVGSRCARRLARGRVPDPDAQWPVTVAVGGLARGVGDLARSYDQARRTSEAARRLGREGRVLRFDDLGVHRLLLQVPDPEDARAFAREVLGRLATDRSERTVELLRTLARYFRCDGSPQRTAKALSVHPNTVGYRLRRAEELSGLSLETYRDRLAAQVALEILGEMEE